jgi:hypothetical protein
MRNHRLGWTGLLALAVAATACGHPEQRVIDQYFNAVNAQDDQTLSSFAAVKFDKKVDSWSIVQVGAESKVAAPLPGMVAKITEIEAEIKKNREKAAAYAQENITAWNQISDILSKNGQVPAKLQPVASEREALNEKDRELKKQLAEAKDAVEREKREVRLSVGDLPDLETLTGEVTTKTLDLSLTIGGQAQSYTMGLKKYDLAGGQGGGRMISRWVIQTLDPK